MQQEEQVMTQVDMLEKCLVCKRELLTKIYQVTQEQQAILDTEPFSEEAFEGTLKAKEEMIATLQQYDQGFEATFGRIREAVLANKELYRAKIEHMQALITELTGQGAHIQTLEQQNKTKLEIYLNSRKQQIKSFHVNNRTVSNYYKSIGGNTGSESYFMDKKR